MSEFKLKSFEEFLNETKGRSKLGYKILSTEEFKEIMIPVMEDIARRWFNPTPQEIEITKKDMEEINDITNFTWEIVPAKR